MSGSISLSLSQQFDELGKPLAGGELYFIEAGTTSTPQNAFQDSALTLPWPNPIILDAAGRVPQFYLADGAIKIRLIDAHGTVQISADNILVVGPSSGSGGGGSVDPTTVWKTGDLKQRYDTGAHDGFVRANGRSIGSSTSGASERANLDCQALFLELYADPNLAVSTGRGANAAADWAANKNIATPDFRGRALAGLADMGNSDNGLFSGVTFASGSSTVLGSLLGAARRTLGLTNVPSHNHGIVDPGHDHQEQMSGGGGASGHLVSSLGSGVQSGSGERTVSNVTGITVANAGGGNPFDSVSPFGLVTIYIKL